ncbi:hypothetical protein [Burkholderia thailandensis]|uniref:hypothetical protein n=1 Tax=Burkholderia thailandensis TaxID=57975 RepID=UPI00217EA307|nr:hypothetical protein [Burkholderia thailandensis]MCS6515153.1 hypothetical protein [Burkholderia thailandensis]
MTQAEPAAPDGPPSVGPFHDGGRAAQRRAGVADAAAESATPARRCAASSPSSNVATYWRPSTPADARPRPDRQPIEC